MPDSLYLNKYWGWDHNQQGGENFYEFNKGIQAPLQCQFDDNKFCGAWCKIKDLLSNQPARYNGYGSGEKNHYRCKKKHTQI